MDVFRIIFVSILAGLLSTMNIWVSKISDIRFGLNDVFMAVLMTGWMLFFDSIITFYFLEDARLLHIFSVLLICATIYFIRKQLFVDDIQYLNGMIPHHSMAVLMSEKIKEKTKNSKILNLANNIIKTQKDEIRLMKELLDD